MKYLLKNILIITGTTTTEGSHKGEEYKLLQADLFNDLDPFGNANMLPRYYSLSAVIVGMFEKYAEPVEGQPGTKKVNEVSLKEAIAKGDSPDITHIDQIFGVEYPLENVYARIYSRDTKSTDGTIIGKAGDFVRGRNGEITPVTKLTLYLKKFLDVNTNEWSWVEQPHDVARRILERNYKLYPNVTTTVEQAPPFPEAGQQSATKEESVEELRAKLAAMTAGQQ